MDYNTITRLFSLAYKGQPNFMTPNILSYGSEGSLAWELSTGRGISDEQIWGITVLENDGTGHPIKRTDLGECFHSRAAAMRYIATLGGNDED